jgi:mannose-1-phosphate guanylyltransferase
MAKGKPPGPCVAIMAGGRGLRLWPRSRSHVPKQLQGFFGGPVLLRQSLTAAAALTSAARTYIITAADLLEPTLALTGPGSRVVAEPFGRDTAACAGLAALHIQRDDPDAVMVLLPSDHWIGDLPAFARTLSLAAGLAAEQNGLVTVGIRPTRPETGYGYIQADPADRGGHRLGLRFREKPDAAEAARLIAGGNVYWNAGIFVVRAATLLDLLDRYAPRVMAGLDRIREALGTPEEPYVTRSVYAGLPAVSLDRAVAEKLEHFLVVPGDFPWDDLGSWTSFARVLPRDGQGNLTAGDVHLCDAEGCLVDTPNLKTALLGVQGLIVVQDGDRLLVASADRAQDVKRLAAAQEEGRPGPAPRDDPEPSGGLDA